MVTSNKFFREALSATTEWFDEGPLPTIVTGSIINSSSIDTSAIDGYRQGVEITQMKHYDAGLIKIHAGDPGHVLKRTYFGMIKNYRFEGYFQDLDKFNAETYIRAQDTGSEPEYDDIFTYPIIIDDNAQHENFIYDGVLEPLTIRPKISMFSTELPFSAHDIHGTLMAGNEDHSYASEIVSNVCYGVLSASNRVSVRKINPFLDQYVDSLVEIDYDSDTPRLPTNVGLFIFDDVNIEPFIDRRIIGNASSSRGYDTGMQAALSLMTGSTDNFINQHLMQRACTSGWTYDSVFDTGTDSIAFGGWTY